MKTLLILGAIEAFCDLIAEAKNMGIQTIACDYFPDAPGKKYADIAYDISTTDVDAVEAIARKHNVDGILCAFSDRNIYSCYEVANRLNLPTFYTKEVIDILTDKVNMKAHFKKHGFPILNYGILKKDFDDSELDGFEYPVIIKPIDASGSKGVIVCDNINSVRTNFDESTKYSAFHKDTLIVEEYYPTNEITIYAWVKGGKAYISCVSDVGKNFAKTAILSSVVFPSKYSKGNMNEFQTLVQNLTDSLNIKEGPIGVQCFIGNRGLKVSEYIYRLTGVSTYKYITHLGGPNFARMLIDYSVNNKIDYQNLETFDSTEKDTVYQYRIYATKPGKIFINFTEQDIKNAIPECSYVKLYSKSGDEFANIPTGGKVIAVVYCNVPNPDKTSFEYFIDKLRDIAIITDEKGNNISNINKPEIPVSRVCFPLKL